MKNTQVDELTEFRQTVSQSHQSKAHFENIFSIVSCYLGDNVSSTMWKDVESSECNFQILVMSIFKYPPQNCTETYVGSKPTFRCALNGVPREKGKIGNIFFRMDYDIVLLFGLTELKAQIAWKENVSLPNLSLIKN